MADNPGLQAALEYARRDLPVFPVHGIDAGGACTCGRECGDSGKHPRIRTGAGLRNATTNPETIRGWWERWPDSNIGIAVPDGMLVVDLDGAEGWTFAATQAPMPPTWCAFTGGGGIHYWYTLPPGLQARNGSGLRPGVDLRAAGGYVVAPPGRHSSGGEYTWAYGQAPGEGPVAEAPAWAVALVNETNRRPAAPSGLREVREEDLRGALPQRIPMFTRNDTLFRHGCRLRARGADEARILEEMLEINATRCEPEGLSQPEVEKTARSVAGYDRGAVRVDNRILNARGLSVRGKVAGALIALQGGELTNEELAELIGRDERTARRWRAELAAAGLESVAADRPLRNYTRVPAEVLMTEGVSAGARALVMAIAQIGDAGRAQVGQEALAEHLGVSERHVRNYRKEAEAAGLIATNRALYTGRLGRREETNRYRLTVGQEEEAAAAGGLYWIDSAKSAKTPSRTYISGSTITTTQAVPSSSPSPLPSPPIIKNGGSLPLSSPSGGSGGESEVENPPDRQAERDEPAAGMPEEDLPDFLRVTCEDRASDRPTPEALAGELQARPAEVKKLMQQGFDLAAVRAILRPAV